MMTSKKEGIEYMQEEDLVKRVRQGDEGAFEQLFDAYKNKALRTACLISGSYADGEDIVQEAFVKCYLNIASLKTDKYFASWFYQILTRTAWEFCRKKKLEQPVADIFEKADDALEQSALDVLVEQEQAGRLYRHITDLDVKHRTVVILYYYNQMSTKEIAGILHCMEGTVKSRLYNARKRLKMVLDKEEVEVHRHAKCGQIG